MKRTFTLALIGATTLITTAAFAQTISVPSADFGGSIGSPDNTVVPNAATVGAAYTLGGSVVVTSGTVTPVIALTWGNETEIQMENSAFPGQFVNFTLSSLTGTYSSIVLGPSTTRFFTGNSIGAAIIPSGSTWSLEFWDSFDDGAGPDATVASLSFAPQGPTAAAYTASNAGPVPSIDNPLDDPGNPTWSGPAVAANFTIGTSAIASADYTAVVVADWPNDTAIVFRNSAYPVNFGFIRPFSATGAFPTLSVTDAVVPVNGSLLHAAVSAGSTFNFQLLNTVNDDGALGTVEGTLANIVVKLTNEAGPAAPAATDLGTVSTGNDISVSITVPTGAVNWYKFTVPQNITLASGNWLDIFTDGVAIQDTEVGLYTAVGAFVGTDDDDADGFYSALSLGAGVNPGIGTGPAFDGRDGDIAAGTYYLAVCEYNGLFGQSFAVSTNGTGVDLFEAFNLTIRTNAVGSSNQTLSGTLNLNDTVFGGAYTRTITGTVKQGATTVGTITVSGINSSSTTFSGDIPASATGAATIEWDGSSFLLRKTNITLTGSNLAVGTVSMQNGDVDGSGEVDAADIDEVIANFGSGDDINSDVDVSGEVDAADIDIVIANFGGTDD